MKFIGSVATSNAAKFATERLSVLCSQVAKSKKAVDETNLGKKVVSCQPSNLPLPDHVNRFVALNRSPSRLKFSEALLGLDSTFEAR
jgi:hypothetical protein